VNGSDDLPYPANRSFGCKQVTKYELSARYKPAAQAEQKLLSKRRQLLHLASQGAIER